MKIDIKTVIIGAMAIGWAYDARVGKWYKKAYKDAKLAYEIQRELSESFEAIIHLYAGKLDRHNVPIDEFDAIAMNEILPKRK